MNVHEFLKSTENRKLRNDFDLIVKQRLEEWTHDLQSRRERLYCQLRFEQLEWEQAMAEWVQAQTEKALRQRHEWIGLERLKKERAEEELLKLKRQQYDVENCAEMRELQSKQILLETKSAQRDQIEERKVLRRREREIERLWVRAWQRLHDIRAEQEEHEQKLRRVIAMATQAENSAREDEIRLRNAFPDNWALPVGHTHVDALNSISNLGKQETRQEPEQQLGEDDRLSCFVAQLSKMENDEESHPSVVESQLRKRLEPEYEAGKETKKHPYSKSVR